MTAPIVVPHSALTPTPESWCVPPAATPDERAKVILSRVYEGLRDPTVQRAAAGLRGCYGGACPERVLAARALERAQACGYRDDPPGCDRYAPVAYTLRHGGDCDDLTPTVMALAILAGLETKLVYLPQPNAPLDHVTALIRVDGVWCWAEASVMGARIGEHPNDAAKRTGRTRALTGGTGVLVPAAAVVPTLMIALGAAALLGVGVAIVGALGSGLASAIGAGVAGAARVNPSRPKRARPNPGKLPLPAELGATVQEQTDGYREERAAALADMDAAIARLRREQLAVPSDARGALGQAKALQQAARAWTRASVANTFVQDAAYELPWFNHDVKIRIAEREKRARLVDAYIGAAVAATTTNEARQWNALRGTLPNAERLDAELRDLADVIAEAQAKAASNKWTIAGTLDDVGSRFGDLLENLGLPTAAKAFDQNQTFRALDVGEARAKLCEDFPKAKACRDKDAPRGNPFAGFKNFAACERASGRKGVDDTGAYCGAIKHRVEGYRTARNARGNPGPPVETWREDTYAVKYSVGDSSHGVAWQTPDGAAYRIDRRGDVFELAVGDADEWDNLRQREVTWTGGLADMPPAALRKIGMRDAVIAQELLARFAELKTHELTAR